MKLNTVFEVSAYALRGLGALIRFWWVILIVFVFISPATPHMRWSYQYIDNGYVNSEIRYINCHYLGIHGLVTPDFAPDCPLFALINPNAWR